jgi:hypothetical protein
VSSTEMVPYLLTAPAAQNITLSDAAASERHPIRISIPAPYDAFRRDLSLGATATPVRRRPGRGWRIGPRVTRQLAGAHP